MICNFCKKNEVTVSIEQISDGVSKNLFLCKECAKRFGLGAFSENIDISVTNLFKQQESLSKIQVSPKCPGCGQRLDDICSNQRIGCAECFSFFKKEISGILQKKRKNLHYTGDIPIEPVKEFTEKISVMELKKQLKKAVEVEDYERAAVLRDEIKRLEDEDVKES